MSKSVDLSKDSLEKFKSFFPESILKRIDNGGIPIHSVNKNYIGKLQDSNVLDIAEIFERDNLFNRMGNIQCLKVASDMLNMGEDGRNAYNIIIGSGTNISAMFNQAIKAFAIELAPYIGRSNLPAIDAVYKALTDYELEMKNEGPEITTDLTKLPPVSVTIQSPSI